LSLIIRDNGAASELVDRELASLSARFDGLGTFESRKATAYYIRAKYSPEYAGWCRASADTYWSMRKYRGAEIDTVLAAFPVRSIGKQDAHSREALRRYLCAERPKLGWRATAFSLTQGIPLYWIAGE